MSQCSDSNSQEDRRYNDLVVRQAATCQPDTESDLYFLSDSSVLCRMIDTLKKNFAAGWDCRFRPDTCVRC